MTSFGREQKRCMGLCMLKDWRSASQRQRALPDVLPGFPLFPHELGPLVRMVSPRALNLAPLRGGWDRGEGCIEASRLPSGGVLLVQPLRRQVEGGQGSGRMRAVLAHRMAQPGNEMVAHRGDFRLGNISVGGPRQAALPEGRFEDVPRPLLRQGLVAVGASCRSCRFQPANLALEDGAEAPILCADGVSNGTPCAKPTQQKKANLQFNNAPQRVLWKAPVGGAPKRPPGTVYYFLLPDDGMANYSDKAAKRLEAADFERIKAFFQPFQEEEIAELETLSN